jgi:hypothetical protein
MLFFYANIFLIEYINPIKEKFTYYKPFYRSKKRVLVKDFFLSVTSKRIILKKPLENQIERILYISDLFLHLHAVGATYLCLIIAK